MNMLKVNRMPRLSLFFRLVPLLYLLLSFLPVNARTIDRIAAIVNDEIITLSDLNMAGQDLLEELRSTPSRERKKKEIETKSLILDSLIEKKLIEQTAGRFGIKASEKELQDTIEDVRNRNGLNQEDFLMALSQSGISYVSYKKRMEAEIVQAKFFERVIKPRVNISKEELKEYYIKTEKAFHTPFEVRLGQILFLIPKGTSDDEKSVVTTRAEMVLKMIREGKDFEDLAAKFSEGPGANMRGDLGYVKKGEMNPEIEEIAFSLGIGEVSDLIETTIGIHIIKVLHIRGGVKKRFSEVKKKIEAILFKQKTEEAYQEWLENMKSTSYIEVKL